jgi:hypothetical protein
MVWLLDKISSSYPVLRSSNKERKFRNVAAKRKKFFYAKVNLHVTGFSTKYNQCKTKYAKFTIKEKKILFAKY